MSVGPSAPYKAGGPLVVHERRFYGELYAGQALSELIKHDSVILSDRYIKGVSPAHCGEFDLHELLNEEWFTVNVSGEEVAGWNIEDKYLSVNSLGPWDPNLDEIDHAIVPWSWLIVTNHDDSGVPSTTLDAAMRVLYDYFDSQAVAERFKVPGWRGVSLTIATAIKRTSATTSGGEVLITAPAPSALSDDTVRAWWSGLFDLIAKIGAGPIASSSGAEGPHAVIEGLVRILDAAKGPDELSLMLEEKFAGLNVVVDAAYMESDVVVVPISGPDAVAALRSLSMAGGRIDGVGRIVVVPPR